MEQKDFVIDTSMLPPLPSVEELFARRQPPLPSDDVNPSLLQSQFDVKEPTIPFGFSPTRPEVTSPISPPCHLANVFDNYNQILVQEAKSSRNCESILNIEPPIKKSRYNFDSSVALAAHQNDNSPEEGEIVDDSDDSTDKSTKHSIGIRKRISLASMSIGHLIKKRQSATGASDRSHEEHHHHHRNSTGRNDHYGQPRHFDSSGDGKPNRRSQQSAHSSTNDRHAVSRTGPSLSKNHHHQSVEMSSNSRTASHKQLHSVGATSQSSSSTHKSSGNHLRLDDVKQKSSGDPRSAERHQKMVRSSDKVHLLCEERSGHKRVSKEEVIKPHEDVKTVGIPICLEQKTGDQHHGRHVELNKSKLSFDWDQEIGVSDDSSVSLKNAKNRLNPDTESGGICGSLDISSDEAGKTLSSTTIESNDSLLVDANVTNKNNQEFEPEDAPLLETSIHCTTAESVVLESQVQSLTTNSSSHQLQFSNAMNVSTSILGADSDIVSANDLELLLRKNDDGQPNCQFSNPSLMDSDALYDFQHSSKFENVQCSAAMVGSNPVCPMSSMDIDSFDGIMQGSSDNDVKSSLPADLTAAQFLSISGDKSCSDAQQILNNITSNSWDRLMAGRQAESPAVTPEHDDPTEISLVSETGQPDSGAVEDSAVESIDVWQHEVDENSTVMTDDATGDQHMGSPTADVGHEFNIIDDLGSDIDEQQEERALPLYNSSESDVEASASDKPLPVFVPPQKSHAERQKRAAERAARNQERPPRRIIQIEGEESYEEPITNVKTVLVEKGTELFEVLPEGWIVVNHSSGMPIYLQKQLRVCTASRPYFIGADSARKHSIPVSAIPCLQYRRALEAEAAAASGGPPVADVTGNAGDVSEAVEQSKPLETSPEPATDLKFSAEKLPSESNKEDGNDLGANINEITGQTMNTKVHSVEDHKKLNCLQPLELRSYCDRLFQFKTFTVRRFRHWKDRRKHNLILKRSSRPILLPSTKLITCTVNSTKVAPTSKKKEFVLNPAGKSHICVLHEYAQHAMHVQPRYIFQELENAETPYSATIVINDIQYGVGFGSSKKAAKLEAARVTLGILIPEMAQLLKSEKTLDLHDLSFFDDVKINDPRVGELCMKAGQPTPFQILGECLKRNFGMGDTAVQVEIKALRHQKSEYTMRVGKHEAKVKCRNKREGKQLAAQALLKLMHPQLTAWGSLLRLYSKSSEIKEKKEEEHSVTELQTKAQPNKAILAKLRQEMSKLYNTRDAINMTVKGMLTCKGPDVLSTELGSVNL